MSKPFLSIENLTQIYPDGGGGDLTVRLEVNTHDEIGDLAPLMQVKLLRVIQEKCIRRIGVRFRIVNCNLRVTCITIGSTAWIQVWIMVTKEPIDNPRSMCI